MPYLLLNGTFQLHEEKLFATDSRLLQFGEGLFESIRVLNQQIPFLSQHAQRLSRSANMLGWAVPPFWNTAFWEEQITSLCQKNNWTNARIKIVVYREGNGTYLPQSDFFSWLITGQKLPSDRFELNETGLQTVEYSYLPKPADILSIVKTTSALRYVQAAKFAFQKGVDEALLTNQYGRFCEASSSNLFIVRENTLLTPPLSEYCLDGVMRSVVLNLARTNGIDCAELPLLKEDLLYADEIFLTNAIKGIQWVAGFEENQYELGAITRRVFGLLNNKV